MIDKWDGHFLELAQHHSKLSKDPSTQSGTILVGPDREVLAMGFNGFPRRVADTDERLLHRETKYKLIVHSELNAILAAARLGISLRGATLYVVSTSRSERFVWGGPPCIRCAVELIQAGITSVRVPIQSSKVRPEWVEDFKVARTVLLEAGISYEELEWPPSH